MTAQTCTTFSSVKMKFNVRVNCFVYIYINISVYINDQKKRYTLLGHGLSQVRYFLSPPPGLPPSLSLLLIFLLFLFLFLFLSHFFFSSSSPPLFPFVFCFSFFANDRLGDRLPDPRRHTCYLFGIPQTAGNAITLFIRTPSVKELLNDCGMGWFQVDFSRKGHMSRRRNWYSKEFSQIAIEICLKKCASVQITLYD